MTRGWFLMAVGLVTLIPAPAGTQDRKGGAVEVLFAPTHDKRMIQARLTDEIGSAKREIVVAVYQFTSRQLADALANARRRGVDVRVLVDGTQAADRGIYGEALKILESGGVALRRVYPAGVDKKGAKMTAQTPRFHHKFCVIDGERLITGSYNWTVQADTDNHENVVLLSKRDVAKQYLDRFEETWKDERITE